MPFCHGSPVGGLDERKPFLWGHGEQYVYFTQNSVVALLYIVHPVNKPFSYYPYGFDPEQRMQVVKKPALGRRSRYYHSQIDMELLLAGNDYRKLPQVYVIFICDFDPFKQKKYKYTFENRCVEEGKLSLRDGRHTIFLSTRGENGGEISRELKKFLEFVRADLQESQKDFEDDFVKQLQNFIFQVKRDREMEGRFMLLELLLQDERAEGVLEGKREGILELLSDLDTVPEDLENEVESQEDPEVLGIWLKLAARASSLEEFRENIHK